MASFVPTPILELAPVIVTFGIVTAKLISAAKLVLPVIFRIAATLDRRSLDRDLAVFGQALGADEAAPGATGRHPVMGC